MASTSSMACTACRMSFATQDEQREHYKLEWHRYNLKRKVANLPPVSFEAFESRVNALKVREKEAFSGRCDICNKHYSTENAYAQHMQSKKHKEAASRPPQSPAPSAAPKSPAPVEDASEDPSAMETDGGAAASPVAREPTAIPVTECLFCRQQFDSMRKNLSHMTRVHSFFLPDIEYLADLAGLLEYLGEKVGLGFMCLYCNDKGRPFKSVYACQAHMIDKSHCKINTDEGYDEFANFYDFRRSYPDWEEQARKMEARRRRKLAEKRQAAEDTKMEDVKEEEPAEGDDDEWVDVSDSEDGASDEEAVPASTALAVPGSNVGPVTLLDSGELRLHGGKTLGTRELVHIYKQRPRPSDRRQAVMINNLVTQYRALTNGETQPRFARNEVDYRSQDRRNIMALKLGLSNNNQSHYRAQVNV